MKSKILIILLLLCSFHLSAQRSIFQDSEGESAFKIFGSGFTINTKDNSIALSLDTLYRKKEGARNHPTKFKRSGLNLKLNAEEGIANIKNSEGFLIDGEFGVYKGWKKTTDPKDTITPAWVDEFYLSIGISGERNKYYDSNKSKKDFIFNEGNLSWKIELGKFGYLKNFLYAISTSGGQMSNIENLKQFKVDEQKFTGFNDSIQVFKETSAYNYNKFSKDLWYWKINADFAFFLMNTPVLKNKSEAIPIYMAVHLRYNVLESYKPRFNPALGLYFGKKGSPQKIFAGFNIQVDDACNVANSENSYWKRTVFNITAGYQFKN